ncbi:SDR family oxidoreductase [Vibrio fortis]|uniref:SDR family oxidoreductase n=1 Tax=Vibrio fortis TaxID=212667 RepID=A0A5N3QTM9_9VIBR|nr:SDR family oxidoreductase [Vibrio fortis]KAB0285519.1 SDR family oxidoreductase [Vibrio fortis]
MKILLTGAFGGFGKLIAKSLAEHGHEVVGTTRNIASNTVLKTELAEVGIKMIEMDVRSDDSVNEGVRNAVGLLGGLDVVINNAGRGTSGYQESFTADDLNTIFDINVFGVQRVTRAVLPYFKAQTSGLIVNTSSLLGRFALPFHGPYSASKWALEGLTETYRYELSGFGIEVCLVEPGGYPTSFIENLMNGSDSRAETYSGLNPTPEFFLERFEEALANNPAQDPQDVADAYVALLAKPFGERPLRTTVDKMGMGEHLEGYNDHISRVTDGIYSAFHINHLLEVKQES